MKIFSYIFISTFLCFSLLKAQNPLTGCDSNQNITVNNTILAKVADKAISTYDVMKKLEIAFTRSFPDLIDSKPARFQFYTAGWQRTLEELINNELILMEAVKKELKISDAEIREEIELKFGPNVMLNLNKANISYEDAMKMTKDEMLIQRMMYYFIKTKADQKITPSAIRNAYRLYCKENPPIETWSYYTISIKSADDKTSKEVAEKALTLFKEKALDPKDLETSLKDIEKTYENCQITISNLYNVTSKEIAASQQKILNSLQKNSYSDLICQTSRSTNKKTNRIYYLKDYEKKETQSFEEVSNKLKENLLNQALVEESEKYFTKLKEQYQVDRNPNITKDFTPFSFE